MQARVQTSQLTRLETQVKALESALWAIIRRREATGKKESLVVYFNGIHFEVLRSTPTQSLIEFAESLGLTSPRISRIATNQGFRPGLVSGRAEIPHLKLPMC